MGIIINIILHIIYLFMRKIIFPCNFIIFGECKARKWKSKQNAKDQRNKIAITK